MEDENDTELDLKPPQKKGYLQKLGGAEGGRQNWKKRFFVLQEDLLYFDSQSQYEKGKEPKGQVTLDCHYTCAVDGHEFEFAVHAYPRTLHCKAESAEEMQEWIDILQKPIRDD
eukprot:g8130.t1